MRPLEQSVNTGSARDLLEKFSDFSVDLGHSVSSAMLKRQAPDKVIR